MDNRDLAWLARSNGELGKLSGLRRVRGWWRIRIRLPRRLLLRRRRRRRLRHRWSSRKRRRRVTLFEIKISRLYLSRRTQRELRISPNKGRSTTRLFSGRHRAPNPWIFAPRRRYFTPLSHAFQWNLIKYFIFIQHATRARPFSRQILFFAWPLYSSRGIPLLFFPWLFFESKFCERVVSLCLYSPQARKTAMFTGAYVV